MNAVFYLGIMLHAIEDIAKHRSAEFLHTVYKAVLFELVIIGEMASRLSKEIREMEAEIPWHRIIGVRHRLVHAPYTIDVNAIEEIVSLHLPVLREKLMQLKKEIKELEK